VATRRMSAENRKRQIVEAALKTIDKYGMHGATMARIAEAAGVTQPALYIYFDGREQVLLAALTTIYEEFFRIQQVSKKESAIDRLREACETYSKYRRSRRTTAHAHLFLEFITSSRKYGLRKVLREKQIRATKELAEIVELGKAQGTVRQDIDSEEAAWMLTGWAWAADVAKLMGVGSSWQPRVSQQLLEIILDRIAVSQPAAGLAPSLSGIGEPGRPEPLR
jgi:AcrR family transcriptional regulator